MKSSLNTRQSLRFLVKTPLLLWGCIAVWVGLASIAIGSEIGLVHPNSNSAEFGPALAVGERTSVDANGIDVDAGGSGDESARIRTLSDLEQFESPFKKSLAFHVLLSNANEKQILTLYKESNDLPADARLSVQKLILQRLAQFDPKVAIEQIELQSESDRFQMIDSVFREWSAESLDEAVAFATTLEDGDRTAALAGILAQRNRLPEVERRRIARQLGNERYAVNLIMQEKLSGPIENPEETWNGLVGEIEGDPGQFWMLATVARDWVDKSGLRVLDQVSDSISDLQTRQLVLGSVLQQAAKANPEGAFEYALKFDDGRSGFRSLTSGVVNTWVASDPRSALIAASRVDKPGMRRSLEEAVVTKWASLKPRDVLSDLETLPEHVHNTATRTAISSLVQSDPTEAAKFVASITGATRVSAASSLVASWTQQESYQDALDWVLREPSVSDLKPLLLPDVLSFLVHVDPQLAMKTALEQPLVQDHPGLEASVIAYLAYKDFDEALEFFPHVRDGTTKTAAYGSVGRILIQSGEISEAIKLAQQLPSSSKGDYFQSLLRTWTESDPTGLLNSIEQLPTAEIKSKAAFALTALNQWNDNLSVEQVERAKEYLSREDSEKLKNGEYSSIRNW